jgi:OPA family glycerol-3-phosphate transporter-like MFS transporter 1/2
VGSLDTAFLFAYAGGMFVSGHLGDRFNLRRFLFLGMLGSGTFCIGFGLAHPLGIHSYYYFMAMQVMAGLFQSTGWPSVVAVVGAWLGHSKKGLIMGVRAFFRTSTL